MTIQTEINPNLTVREATLDDADSCGRIFFDAFAAIAARHNFPVEPGSPEFTNYKIGELLETEGIFGMVAERDATIVGSAFADERGHVVGIGPVTVDPDVQDAGVGTTLMHGLLERQRARRVAGVRLVQTAYNSRSLALYAKLGFTVREPLSVLQGNLPPCSTPGLVVRAACLDDLAICDAICTRIHGHDRSAELQAAIASGTATVVERAGSIVGYATGFGYGWHAIAESNEPMIALLSSAQSFMGLGIFVPSRNAPLLELCLKQGLRLVQQSTLMTIGLYNEPAGSWLPSIVY